MLRRFLPPLVLLFSTLLPVAACGQSSPFGGKSARATPSPAEPGRPSDAGEGVPGYLVDPAKVAVYERPDGSLVVDAPPGAIAASDTGASPADVAITIWRVESSALATALAGAVGTQLTGEALLTAHAVADGSFLGRLPAGSLAFVVTTSGHPGEGGQLVVGDPGAPVTAAFWQTGGDRLGALVPRAPPVPGSTEELTFPAVHDAYITGKAAGSAPFNDAELHLKHESKADDSMRPYLGFDVGALPPDAEIVDASLELVFRAFAGSQSTVGVTLFRANAPFDEATIDAFNQPGGDRSVSFGAAALQAGAAPGTVFAWGKDVKALRDYLDAARAGDKKVFFTLDSLTIPYWEFAFGSSEAPDEAQRPRLKVTIRH